VPQPVPSASALVMESSARSILEGKAKPPQSLGLLEDWAVQLAVLQKTLTPRIQKGTLLVVCADHGVVQNRVAGVDSVSAYPARVSAVVYRALKDGKAAGAVLAHSIGLELVLRDVGINWNPESDPEPRVFAGTRDFTVEPAMDPEACKIAMNAGREEVAKLEHSQVVCIGEVGIGNTTSASALICALTSAPAAQVCGRGTGLDDLGILRKIAAVEKAIDLHRAALTDPVRTLECLGGLEIAAMVGAILEAYERRIAVIVDGFISCAAALTAFKINPECKQAMFFSHKSVESGVVFVFRELNVKSVLDLEFRLGEGTGAVLAYPILKAAGDMMCDMISLQEALETYG